MNPSLRWSIIGVVVAIAITTTMDATGLSMFSALPLFPLMALFWFLGRFSRVEIGFVWARRADYVPALLYPLIVLGDAVLLALIAGAIDISQADWQKTGLNLVLVTATTFIVTIITEEGFFRGWLWASLGRAGLDEKRVLIWSSVAFSLWHLSAVSLDTGFDIPTAQIPVFMVNATVMGAIWGMLRLASGSVIVASVSHGVWNGITYPLFGFGPESGTLGIHPTSIFGPEVGVLGLVLNIVFAVVLWRWWKMRQSLPVFAKGEEPL